MASVQGDFSIDETRRAVTELMEDESLDGPETRMPWDMSEAALMGLSTLDFK